MRPFTMRNVSKHPERIRRRRELSMQVDLFGPPGGALAEHELFLKAIHKLKADYWRNEWEVKKLND